jgi:TadE-like protein
MRLGTAGTTSLEMAAVMVAFLTLLLGAMDLGRYLFTVQSIQALVGQAERAGVVGNLLLGSGSSCPLVSSIPTSTLGFTPPPFLDPGATLCVTNNGNVSAIVTVTVTVTSPFTSFTPGLGSLTGTLTQSAQVSY